MPIAMWRNLLSGSAICVAIVSGFWVAGIWPGGATRWGVRLLVGGGLLVPATGAILAVLSFSGAGRLKRWAVASAAANTAYCAAYWMFILR